MVTKARCMQRDAWNGRRVVVTGHTGFKGGWMSLWLARLGAKVTGISLPPSTAPSLFELAHISSITDSHFCDIRDLVQLRERVTKAEPEVIFHLAAQPLVRASYRDPVETWTTNVIGTVNLLEAARACPGVKAMVIVTTDKCYENHEWFWGYRENDALGGYDPYSASKAGVELVVASYRRSFFSNGLPLIASARAGNVIGGGDWSEDRLIPDAARAMTSRQPLAIRNPAATRPWQHVLEPLHGYLILADHLLSGEAAAAGAYNFGPDREGNRSVLDVLKTLQTFWPELQVNMPASAETSSGPHEASFLHLDSSKAWCNLGWKPVWSLSETIAQTAEWYSQVAANPTAARTCCEEQILKFESDQLAHGTD